MKSDGLIIIGRLSYPSGTAPSNRVHLYCKALKEANGFPFVINLHSTFNTQQNFNYLGRYEGVPFYYSQKTPLRETRFIQRNINKIKGLINAIVITKRLQIKYNIKVLFYATTFFDELIFFIFLKLMKISMIRDCSEAPLFIIHEKKAIKLNNFFLQLKFKMYDEIIVISDHLNNYYSSIFPINKIFQIPILVDMERFRYCIKSGTKAKKTITYTGYMGGNKDGLENLIEAMAMVRKKISNAQLKLVGSASKEDMIRLKNIVENLGLADFVFFSGPKRTDEIPAILGNSDVLVLARPNNNQARAGFPTKLGEYLASGKPVVITKTGEIPKYLIDCESAYLSEPDDINNFAEKVIFALNDENSKKIGAKGMEIANKNFNYKLYGKKILEIIQN